MSVIVTAPHAFTIASKEQSNFQSCNIHSIEQEKKKITVFYIYP